MPSRSKRTKTSQPGPTVKSAIPQLNVSQQAKPNLPPPEEDELPPLEPIERERTGDTTESAGEVAQLPSVNRKKQKRREKEAAKRLAEQQAQLSNGHVEDDLDFDPEPEPLRQNGHLPPARQARGPVKGYFTEETDYVDPDFQDQLVEGEEDYLTGDEDIEYTESYPDGPEHSWLNTSKRRKGSKRHMAPAHMPNTGSTLQKPFPTLSNAALRSAHKMSAANDHIWNTSTHAERENIKQFWLELGEDERRSLVRVEKEAVLRKMKEQQKHSCSCSVCGRKRTAIEEELEVLYDAYYQELEQFANHDQDPESPSTAAPPRTPIAYRNQSHQMAGAYPVQGRIQELGEDGEELEDDEEEDEYDEEEDDDDYSEDYEDELPPGPADFFQFGNSLTVKDGILTVADDLLKNDGKHFIDMMEQLAERRMQRETEIHYPVPPLAHSSSREGHNHPPIDDEDDYDDEEDDEDYDSQEEDDYEGDEMDSMTEEQRMEEGRRMFQIFAARMFEQRVLTAYKEKVAAERQRALLEELEGDLTQQAQKEAKKAKDAAKKKEKKARQKAVQAEEKAKKDAEKAAQEAALREEEEKKLAEKRAKQEEQRKKREAERKAAEEERLRKEAEKAARAQKERERQQEVERKAKEAKEREKKARDEQKKREREEREAKEAEAREKRLQEEKDRKEKEAQQRKEREASAKAEKEVRERQKAELASRPQPVALPPGLGPPARNQLHSPQVLVATPIIPPNVPTQAARGRQVSQPSQQSHTSSPRSQQAQTEHSQSSGSPANLPPAQAPIGHAPKHPRQGPPLHHPQPNAPRSPLNNFGFNGRGGLPQHGFGHHHHGIGVNGIPTSMAGQMSMNGPAHMYQGQPMGNQHRYPPNGLPFPPGFNHRPYQPQPNHFQHAQPNIGPIISPQPPAVAPPTHSRQPSGSDHSSQPGPIGRPGPIARPTSTTPDRQKGDPDVEKITTQLGSSALLADSEEAFTGQAENRAPAIPLAPPGTGRLPFASTFAQDIKPPGFGLGGPNWNAFSHNGPPGPFAQTPRQGQGWSQPPFDPMGTQNSLPRSHVPRPIAVRLMLVQACRTLSASAGKSDGYHPAHEVLRRVEQQQQPGEPPVSMEELLGICDTEGNVQNGGGMFEVMMDPVRGQVIKFAEDNKGLGVSRSSLGDIGSPIVPPGVHAAPFGSIGQGVQHHGNAFRPQPPGPPGKW